MSEFTLPANSKVGEGKHWALPQPAEHVKSFRIYRWDPAKNANPTMDTFDIDRDHCGLMVLDALVKINDQIDQSLAFRRSCREGVWGSCAMNIDGVNTLACLTPMESLKRGSSRITPLPHLQVLKDLVPDLTGLYAQYELIEPWLQTDQPPPDRERRQSQEERAQLDGLWECILCSAARPGARATGGTKTATSARRSCCNSIAGSPTAATSAPASGSTGSRIRSVSTTATPL
jgi:succinate dehydrogenase / fumarate reductase iron-sulfur subunit